MNARVIAAVAAFLLFAAYTVTVMVSHGSTGFIALAFADPWAMQMLIDLGIALCLFSVVVVRDARKLGITPWPYLVAMALTGSIGALAYLVHREMRVRRVSLSPA